MLVWEDINYTDKDILNKIEDTGKEIGHLVYPNNEPGEIWTFNFKKWEYPFIWSFLKDKKNLDILDFGCGSSPFPQVLAEYNKVTAVDTDEDGLILRVGKKKLASHMNKVNYIFEDIQVVKDKFDFIYSCSVIEHINPEILPVILEYLNGLLKHGGRIVHIVDIYLQGFNKTGNRYHVDIYKIMNMFGWNYNNEEECPGSPKYNPNKIKNKINLRLKNKPQTRIAIGNDDTRII